MGWTFSHRAKGTSTKEFFEGEFNSADGMYKVLDCKANSGEVYIALQVPNNEVIGVVCLTQYVKDVYNFGYKDITEDMGPCYYNCPKSILDKLTPTTNALALKWRETCRSVIEKRAKIKKLQPGMKVQRGNNVFTLLERKRGWWLGALTSAKYKLTDKWLAENETILL